MKKIISFSLWGEDPKYIEGAISNAFLAKNLFSDWICRFYIDDTVDEKVIKKIKAENDNIEIVEIKDEKQSSENYSTSGINPGWFWRFKVLSDKDVERFIVRDADSRLSRREKNCVSDWEKSKKQFHIIRDHPMHGVPILVGTWGATREFMDSIDYETLLSNFKNNNPVNNTMYGGYDQFFLSTIFYPLIKKKSCIHDSHPHPRYPEERVSLRIFPALSLSYPVEHFIGRSYDNPFGHKIEI